MMMPSIFRDNLFDDLWNGVTKPLDSFRNAPAAPMMKTDVKDMDDHFELVTDLPGVKKEDLKVELKDGCLTIKATYGSSSEEKSENEKYIRRERYFGSTSRSFYVGEEIRQEDVKASFNEGVLTIQVPKPQPEPEVVTDYSINID